MYKSYFQLARNPFDLTPDPTCFVPTERHNETLASLYYGVRRHKGFVVVTGEVGTGKTLLLRCLLRLLEESRDITYAYIFNNRLNFNRISSVHALGLWPAGFGEEQVRDVIRPEPVLGVKVIQADDDSSRLSMRRISCPMNSWRKSGCFRTWRPTTTNCCRLFWWANRNSTRSWIPRA